MEAELFKCPYCHHKGPPKDFHIEHIVAKKQRAERKKRPLFNEKGIYDILPDTMPACGKCNQSKGAMSPGNWARWLKSHPDKWHPWPDGDRQRWMNMMLSMP